MWWSTGSGRIELNIKVKDADRCHHPGPADWDVKANSKLSYITKQLKKISPELLAAELKEYGAWSPEELSDHDQNLQRILWLACCDIAEEHFLKSQS